MHPVIDGSGSVQAVRERQPGPAAHGRQVRHGHEARRAVQDHEHRRRVRRGPPDRLAALQRSRLALHLRAGRGRHEGHRAVGRADGRGTASACALLGLPDAQPAGHRGPRLQRLGRGRDQRTRLRSAARARPASRRSAAGGAPLRSSVSTRRIRCGAPRAGQQLAQPLAERAVQLARSRSACRCASSAAARRPTATAPCAACPRRGTHAVVDAVHVPVGVGSRCPPLRSALLITASKTAMRRSASTSRRRMNATMSTVVVVVDPELHHARARAARRGRPSAARCPSRWPPTPRRRRPRARPACRPGSPTAAAPPPPACRRRRH